MFIRRYSFYLLPILFAAIIFGLPVKSQFNVALQTGGNLIAGRNVNMVSGTQLPYGDPWLQRQNEPSIAVSTRNPLHLLAGANDYRTIDMPQELPGEVPGQEEKMAQAVGREPWVGVFKSFDGGQTWITTLLPGFPLDSSPEGGFSPLKGGSWEAAADPVVRAGTNGMFYYSGIAFHRESKVGVLFVARFIDNNNRETNSKAADCIKYIDTKIIAVSGTGIFIDKPWMTVGLLKNQTTKVIINGQNILSHNVYVVYSEFTGTGATLASKIRFVKSEDCGMTWSQPIQLSEGSDANQGATIAVDPLGNGHICVAWRRFAKQGTSNSIFFTRSTDWGKSFGKVKEISTFYPFDQGSSSVTFRTNSYPTLVIDDLGYIYVAWSQRMGGPSASARIVLSRSDDGQKWSTPTPVDNAGARGHQFMPSLTFAENKLMLAWYDQRDDNSGSFYETYIADSGHNLRHTLDVRVAEAERGKNPVFNPSVKVSRYSFVLVLDQNTGKLKPTQAQWNPFNYPLFKNGSWPFMGDYIDISPSPMFVLDKTGHWKYNSDPSSASIYHVAWTDNRDVRPPTGGNWQAYGPPNSSQVGPFGQTSFCNSYENAGMRNQNVYTSVITKGVIVGSPGNTKPLGTLGKTPDGKRIPRAFVVFVRNTTSVIKSFRLTFANQPKNGRASFLEFKDLFTLDVKVAPYSSISRSAFVDSTDRKASVEVDVAEIDQPFGQLVSGGLASYVILNPEIENPEIENPEIENPDILAAEVHNPEIENPEIINWNYNILNPEIINPEIENPEIINPEIINPEIENPEIENPEIINPEIENPNIADPSAGQLADVVWKLKNLGNTTSSYIFKTLSTAAREDGTLPGGIMTQLLVYRVYKTPAEHGSSSPSCDLREQQHHELILNITNPEIENPEIENPEIENPEIENPEIENATFNLEPNGEALVLLRLWKPNQSSAQSLGGVKTLSMADITGTLIGYASGTSRNTTELQAGVPTYPATASELIITTKFFSDGRVGQSYSDFLTAAGGTKPYTWSIINGSLPAGLSLNPTTGQISGTPTTAGTSSFTVQVTDHDGISRTQDCWIAIFGATGGYTISGRVMVGGTGLEGVVMNGLPGSPVTDSSGYYSSVVTPNWSGIVTPQNPAYTYSPASKTYTNVTSDQVTYYGATIITFTITATAGPNGGISPSGTISVNYGANQTFIIAPDPGYRVADVLVDGGSVGAQTSYTFTNVTANHTILANFAMVLDTTPPTVSAFDPPDDASNVPIAKDLKITFSENVVVGSGYIVIHRSSDDTTFETINATDTSKVSVSANIVTINPTGIFESLTGYYVRIEASCFKDTAGNFFAGILDKTTWNFTTAFGLVAYYPFNGNANDESGNGNNGTVSGATLTTDRFGNANSAYYFNGQNAVITTTKGHFGLDNKLSISLWVNIPAGTSNTEYFVYCSDGGVWQQGDQIGLAIFHPGTASASATITYGGWHHFAGTFDGTTIRAYLDGTPAGVYNWPGPLSDAGEALRFGYYNNVYWQGNLDDVRIYNYTLSASEIQALYNREQGGMVAYYPFNGNANDESGNGLNGTPVGAALANDRHGNANSAFSFNGQDDEITVQPNSLLDITGPISLAAWIYPLETKTQDIVRRSNLAIGPYGLATSATGDIVFELSFSGVIQQVRKSGYTLNAWSLIVGTYDGNAMNLYVNGSLVATASHSGSIDKRPTDVFLIGTRLRLPADTFHGSLDDIRIYNRALSASEISTLYNAEK